MVKPSGNNTIKQIDDHFKSANNDPEIVGAGGERRLIFQAVQAGEDSIVLWNGRSLDDILEYSTDPELIFEKFKNKVDAIIDGGFGHNIASTIVLCENDHFEVIRHGLGDFSQFES